MTGFIAETIVAYAIGKGLDIALANREDFKQRLNKIIEASIDEYVERYNIYEPKGKYAFFRSQPFMEEVLKFRLFKRDGYKIDQVKLEKELSKFQDFISPSEEDLDNFMQVFDSRVNADEKLRLLEIETFYKEEVFEITQKLNRVLHYLETSVKETINLLEGEYERELNECLEDIHSFKPESALRRIEGIQAQVINNAKHVGDRLKANLYHLKAICLGLLQDTEKVNENILKSFRLAPHNEVYLQKACYTYYIIGDRKYETLVSKLEIVEEYSPYLWAVKTLQHKGDALAFVEQEVPEIVKNKIDYKRLVFYHLMNASNQELSRVLKALREEENGELPGTITYESFRYWILKLNVAYSNYMRNTPIMLNERAGVTEEGLFVYKLAEKVLEVIKDSEVFEKYTEVEFIYYWLEFELYERPNTIDRLKQSFKRQSVQRNDFTLLFANALFKSGCLDEALEVINTYKGEPGRYLLSLKAFCLFFKDDIIGYQTEVEKYLESLDSINEHNIVETLNVLSPVKSDAHNWNRIHDILDQKHFSRKDYQTLLNLFLFRTKAEPLNQEKLIQLERMKGIFSDEQGICYSLALIYFSCGEYKQGVELLASYINEDKPSRDLLLYINGLDTLKDQGQLTFLRLLKKWREEFPYNDALLRREIEIRTYLNDWLEIQKIAAYGLTMNALDESYWTAYILSLDRSGNEDAIEEAVDKVKELTFRSTPNAMLVAGVLSRRGHYHEALDIVYEKAINQLDSVARQNYFALLLRLPEELLAAYDTVEEGRYVKYQIDGKEQIVFINDESLIQNPIVNGSLHRKVNEYFTVTTGLSRRLQTVKILRVMNKYLALHDEILLEARDNPINNLQLESINYKSDDIKDFERTFVEMFGAQEHERQKRTDENLKNYYDFNLSFSELVMGNYNSDYIGAYYFITSKAGNGLVVTPIRYYKQEVDVETSTIVIDFPTGLLLYELSKEVKIEIKSFVISNSFISIIDNEILKAKHDPKTELSLSVINGKVVPHFLPEDYNSKRLALLEEFKLWVNERSRVEVPEEKLDGARKLYEQKEVNKVFEHCIDNVTLALRENHILLTDDSLNFKLLSRLSGKIISSEYYLRNTYPNKQNEIYEFLLQKKFRGISLSTEHLRLAYFNQHKLGKQHLYNAALLNLSLNVNFSLDLVTVCITFLKQLALSGSISDEKYRMDAANLFVHLLKGNTTPTIGTLLTDTIQKEFHLLPKHLLVTLMALKDAVAIFD